MQQPQPQQPQQLPLMSGGAPPGDAPGDQRSHLYVGNLNPKVNEAALVEIFSTAGPVLSVKIIPDRNVSTDWTEDVADFSCNTADSITDS